VQSAGKKPEVRNEMLRVVSGCCPLTVYYFRYSGLDLCSSLGTWLWRVHRTLTYSWKSAEYLALTELTEKSQSQLLVRTGKVVVEPEPENELKKSTFYTHFRVLFLGFHTTLSLLVSAMGVVSTDLTPQVVFAEQLLYQRLLYIKC
jgi:hypothetical protein